MKDLWAMTAMTGCFCWQLKNAAMIGYDGYGRETQLGCWGRDIRAGSGGEKSKDLPKSMYVKLEPAHQRQNIFTRIASWNVLALLMTETCAETILRQCWSAEKLPPNGCLQYVVVANDTYVASLWQIWCKKASARVLIRRPTKTEGVRTFCTRPLSHTVWSDLGPGSNPNSWQFLGACRKCKLGQSTYRWMMYMLSV